MPYLFTCPHCQTQTQVEDRYSGRSGNCVACSGPIELPVFAPHSPAPSSQWFRPAVGWIAAAVVAVLLVASLGYLILRVGGPALSTLASTQMQTASLRNLEEIAVALNAYAADHGRYPPSFTQDAAQGPMHSWRVLILPYLGEEELYNQFRLDLPWDDPANQSVAAIQMPSVYRHPSQGGMLAVESGYYLITGPGTLFPDPGGISPAEIHDGPAKTILVTEGMPVVPATLWTEPIDLDLAQIQGQLGINPGTPGGRIPGVVGLATADGRGHSISDTTPAAVFKALVTPRGNERLPDDVLD